MIKFKKSTMFLIISFLLIQLITVIGLVKHMRFGYACDTLTTTVFFIILMVLHFKYNQYTNNYLITLIVITLISHNLFGEYMNFYITSSLFDRVLHVLGTYTLTYYTYTLIKGLTNETINTRFLQFIFIVSIGISLGGIFEIIEFLTDIIFKPQIRYQTNLVDTDLDLISDIVGAIIASFHLVK